MGTPHALCREMHQSVRSLIMLIILVSPHVGTQWTFLTSANKLSRIGSIEQNHWGVARKMSGFFVRQS